MGHAHFFSNVWNFSACSSSNDLDEIPETSGTTSSPPVASPPPPIDCNEQENIPDNQSCPLNDIGHAVKLRGTLDRATKYRLFKQTWMPDSGIKLPTYVEKTGKTRNFDRGWFEAFNWFAYSDLFKGGFCKCCVLFGKAKSQKLVDNPFSGVWLQRGKAALSDHEKTQQHQTAKQIGFIFLEKYDQPETAVDCQLSGQKRQQDEERRSLITYIVQAVMFLGKQNLALRGHFEKLRNLKESEFFLNRGNFLELLSFLGKYVPEVQRHLTNPSALNATHLSATSQNEIIDLIGNQIRDGILSEVKESGFYSILGDESTDNSAKEQLSLVLRYFFNKKLQERFMTFINVHETTGKAIAENILACLKEWGLDIQKLRGQGYDGASNMSGHTNGVKALIQNEARLALNTHCYSHRLNLVIMKTCSEPLVRSKLGHVQSITTFIRDSAKRIGIWEKNLPPECPKRRLRKLCPTRWIEHTEALEEFRGLLVHVVETLTDISAERSNSSSTAESFLHTICNFPFLVTLVVAEKLLSFSLPVCRKLQGREMDILAASREAHKALAGIQTWRNEQRFELIFKEAEELAETLGVTVAVPRVTGRQKHRASHPANSPEQYYYRSLYLSLLDHFIQAMEDRFSTENQTDFLATALIPAQMEGKNDLEIQKEIQPLIEMYRTDLPAPSQLDAEITSWLIFWQEKEKVDTVYSALKACDYECFPNLHTLLKIMVVLPVTTCENERSFSALKRLKTYLRNTMGNERLVGLALMHMHRDKLNELPEKKIVDAYCTSQRRGIAALS